MTKIELTTTTGRFDRGVASAGATTFRVKPCKMGVQGLYICYRIRLTIFGTGNEDVEDRVCELVKGLGRQAGRGRYCQSLLRTRRTIGSR